jgi:hypothetical protein
MLLMFITSTLPTAYCSYYNRSKSWTSQIHINPCMINIWKAWMVYKLWLISSLAVTEWKTFLQWSTHYIAKEFSAVLQKSLVFMFNYCNNRHITVKFRCHSTNRAKNFLSYIHKIKKMFSTVRLKTLTYQKVFNSHCYWLIVNYGCKLQVWSPYTTWHLITQTKFEYGL